MLIGVPAETTAGETRVAVTPETAKKIIAQGHTVHVQSGCLLYTSPSPRDGLLSRMPSSA